VIILSGVLVVVAIALLVTGIVTGNTGHEVAGLDGLKLIYVSIGVSIISALCLAIGVFLRRKELFGSAEPATAKGSAASRSGKTARPAKAKARVGASEETVVVPATSATALDVPAETMVFVVPGRKRYHLETCRQLAGRDKEELTFVEAREEGFTACTACLPDTALAARAALTEPVPADESADARSTESRESAADTADLRHPDDDPAQVTRTDLPVTRLETDTADTDIAEIQPAAESPAAAGLRDAPEPSAPAETDEARETSRLAEADETPAATPEPETDRPSARRRSFFEPLERSAEDEETADATPPAADTTHTDPPAVDTAEADTAHTADTDTADTAEADSTDTDTADTGTIDKGTSDEDAVTEPSEPEDTAAEDLDHAEPASEEPSEPEALQKPEPDSTEDTPEPAEAPADADHDTAGHEATETASNTDDAADVADPGTEAPAAEEDTDSEAADLSFVRILSGTKRYHRPDCALIEDIAEDADDLETVTPAAAKERGCTPCLVCQPDKDPSDDVF